VLLERASLERRFAGFVERGDAALTAAVDPSHVPGDDAS
jgi:hypothetical protein